MDVRPMLEALVGEWTGTNRLWFMPGTPAHESAATARVARVAGGFLSLAITWAHDGVPQDGLLLLRPAPEGPLAAVWVDSLHTQGAFMTFRGSADAADRWSGHGAYAAPDGPDWGWRLQLEPDGPDGFRLAMFNLPPGMGELLAVDARFRRAGR